MVKIEKISEIEPCLGFTEFDILKKISSKFCNEWIRSSLFPFSELARQMHLKSSPLGRKSYFSPEGKIALMVLKSYTNFSDSQLIEHLNGNEEVTDPCPVKLYKYSVSDIDHLTTTSTIVIELQDGTFSNEEEYGIIPNGNREVDYALKEAPIWDGRKSQYYNSEGMQEICILRLKNEIEDPIPYN